MKIKITNKKLALIITAVVVVLAIAATVIIIAFQNSPKVKKKIIRKNVIVVNNSNDNSAENQFDGDYDDYDYEYDYEDDYEDDFKDDFEDDYEYDSKGLFYVAKKKTGKNIGKNYYVVSLKDEHPGVVGYDAEYEVTVYDKMGNLIPNNELNITVDNSNIKNKNGKLTVPYSVRNSGKKLVVKVKNKTFANLTGELVFDFLKFTDKATFKDDFNKLDTDMWLYQKTNKVSSDKVYVKNGSLVLESKSATNITNLASAFKQSYGCFSARIKMHNKGLADFAFSLRTEQRYIKNEEMVIESGGEITIAEYFPYWKNKWSSCVRWFGWNSYTKKSRNDSLVCKGISDAFHDYSVVWTTDSIFWYLDGKLVNTYTGEGVGKGSNAMNLCLKLTSYGKDDYRGGPFEPDAFPISVEVDRITAYGLID